MRTRALLVVVAAALVVPAVPARAATGGFGVPSAGDGTVASAGAVGFATPTPASHPSKPRARKPPRRRPPHRKPPRPPAHDHRFPLAGPFTWPNAGGEFGAGRTGHVHQGFDLLAPAGTPIVAPHAATITVVARQSLAGNYVVMRGAGEPYDYAFMHLLDRSTVVRAGQHVRMGERIGSVGQTGDATGPHLHFEIWRGAWQSGGRPIDPKPFLKRWASWLR